MKETRSLEEKFCLVSTEADKAKDKIEVLEAELEVEKVDRLKVEEDVAIKQKTLADELEHYLFFLIRISKQSFNQGIRQTTFYHGVPIDDSSYDEEKDVIDGKLVSVGGDEEEDEVEGQGENLDRPINVVEHSLKELFDPL